MKSQYCPIIVSDCYVLIIYILLIFTIVSRCQDMLNKYYNITTQFNNKIRIKMIMFQISSFNLYSSR